MNSLLQGVQDYYDHILLNKPFLIGDNSEISVKIREIEQLKARMTRRKLRLLSKISKIHQEVSDIEMSLILMDEERYLLLEKLLEDKSIK